MSEPDRTRRRAPRGQPTPPAVAAIASVRRRCLALLLMLAVAGCAGHPALAPRTPDDSALAPAQQALDKARDAQADSFAPRAVDAARRRIATARDIIFDAARARRELTAAERQRVDALVAAARLDARSALVQTQARAVVAKLDEMTRSRGGAPGGNGMAGRPAPADAKRSSP